MKELKYKCKMCYREGIAEYDDECPAWNLGIWSRQLICNPCGQHRDQVMNKAGTIKWIAQKLIYLSALREDKATKAIDTIRDALVVKTRELASFVCRRHRKSYVWDMEFVNNIMRRPEKAVEYCWMFDRMVFNNNQLPVESFDTEPIKTPHIQS